MLMIASREWDVCLRGRHVLLRTDHKPIRYLQTKARLSAEPFLFQARWLNEIQSYDFDVEHVPGKNNIVPDMLSRRKGYSPILNAMQFVADDFLIKASEAYNTDDWFLVIMKALDGENTQPDVSEAKHVKHFACDGKFIHRIGSNESRVLLPKRGKLRADIISSFHDFALLGIDKIYNSKSHTLYWPRMYREVASFVSICQEFQVNKVQPVIELRLHDIPQNCWDCITADFLSELPVSRYGNDSILVVVDKLSKRGISIPSKKTNTAADVANFIRRKRFFQERCSNVHLVRQGS